MLSDNWKASKKNRFGRGKELDPYWNIINGQPLEHQILPQPLLQSHAQPTRRFLKHFQMIQDLRANWWLEEDDPFLFGMTSFQLRPFQKAATNSPKKIRIPKCFPPVNNNQPATLTAHNAHNATPSWYNFHKPPQGINGSPSYSTFPEGKGPRPRAKGGTKFGKGKHVNMIEKSAVFQTKLL